MVGKENKVKKSILTVRHPINKPTNSVAHTKNYVLALLVENLKMFLNLTFVNLLEFSLIT